MGAVVKESLRTETQEEELRAFMLVVYRALRMICSFLERRYGF
jgi:hypothetical protein